MDLAPNSTSCEVAEIAGGRDTSRYTEAADIGAAHINRQLGLAEIPPGNRADRTKRKQYMEIRGKQRGGI